MRRWTAGGRLVVAFAVRGQGGCAGKRRAREAAAGDALRMYSKGALLQLLGICEHNRHGIAADCLVFAAGGGGGGGSQV
jgi:hypothetical protein